MQKPPPHHPVLAATLSFVFPGLGHAYIGLGWLAALLASPVLLLLGIGLVGYLVYGAELRNNLLSAPFLIGLLVLDLALLFWRAFAIGHSALAIPQGPRGRPSGQTVAAVLALVALSVGMHMYVAVVLDRLNDTLAQVFSGGQVGPPGSGGGGAPMPRQPLNEPDYNWDGTERINFLLLGTDDAPGREHALTDTILVVSVDPIAETAVMVSVPRDTGYTPLPSTRIYQSGLYPRKINELATEASENRELWCPELSEATSCGIRALERTVGLYLGIPIHYYARVDLVGFTQLIDALGGVELCLDGTLVDPQYTGPGWEGRGIELPAGCRHYSGPEALAYARIRVGELILPSGEREQQDDFLRAERQQLLLLALRRGLADMDLVFELPGTLEAIARTVQTDFPRDQAGDLATLLPLITGDDVDRHVLGLPEYTDPPVDPTTNYLLIPKRDAIRDLATELFGPTLEGWYLGTDDPAPTESAASLLIP